MAEPLFCYRERLLVLAAFGIDQPIGSKPGLREPWREQVMAAEHPQHRAAKPCGNARREQGRRGIVGEARTGA